MCRGELGFCGDGRSFVGFWVVEFMGGLALFGIVAAADGDWG